MSDANKTIKRVIVVGSSYKEASIVPTSIPQKRKLDTQSNNIYEPDIESFVSNCIPGVCFTSTNNQRKTKIRKRSLPSLQYLATVELSEAEKRRSKMEKGVQDAKAKEEARRILLNQNEQSATLESDGDAKVAQTESVAAVKINDEEKANSSTVTTTTTIERKSNILNPPILQDFLDKVRKRRALDK